MNRIVYLPPRWRVNLDTLAVEQFIRRRATKNTPALAYWCRLDPHVDTSSIIDAAKEKDAASQA